ncbi:MAG: hypothetical protein EBR82_70880 [Caulobacteraceae bacterium]|nr:hypothetical protein [Caulobacteraceae bacterium]
MNGFIFYRGASPIDGAPLSQTTAKPETWSKRGSCAKISARPWRAEPVPTARIVGIVRCANPASIWHAYHRGGYVDLRRKPAVMRRIVSGRMVRMGAAGDPAMIPLQHWLRVLQGADGWTGYSHQWKHPWAQPMRELTMASVESLEDQDLARSMGWRTYRIRRQDEPLEFKPKMYRLRSLRWRFETFSR